MPIIIHLFSFLNKKNLETTILLQGLITGDERIELPLRVLETPVIPFDQSPIFTCCRSQPTRYLYHRIYTVVKKIMAIICQSYIYNAT